MNIGVISDLHGSDAWKLLVERAQDLELDQIVFMGDYIDDFDGSDREHIANLRAVMDLEIPGVEIIRLIGNHDAQYFLNQHFPKCSGYRESYAAAVGLIFEENKKKLKFAHQVDNILFTHAGVSGRWINNIDWDTDPLNKVIPNPLTPSYADLLEMLSCVQYGIGELRCIGLIRGGSDPVGGPLWADRRETKAREDQLPGIHQVVGHSMIKEITMYDYPDINASITYADCLRYRKQFLILGTGELEMAHSVLDLTEVPKLISVTQAGFTATPV